MKPILFNTPMVQAVDEERKTATRRLVTPQPIFREGETGTPVRCDDGHWCFKIDQHTNVYDFDLKPKYEPGDVLYVRETWKIQSGSRFASEARIEFRAGGPMSSVQFPGRCSDSHERPSYDAFISKWGVNRKWHPSIHMPKEAARIFLRVTAVRVERLQNISADQCAMEGVWPLYSGPVGGREAYYKTAFAKLWDSTIKEQKRDTCSWEANPWVFVYEFEKISKEEATKC